MGSAVHDLLDRPLKSLRISVTDRCNLRCRYCMPEAEYVWLPRSDLLQFEEIQALVEIFVDLGVEKVRLTGGEPLLRRDLQDLVSMLARVSGLRELALTTNGLGLADQARGLRKAGLQRLTVSLDTLRPERFQALTRRDEHALVLKGIAAAIEAGFRGIKIDAVVLRGVNEDELGDLVRYGESIQAEVRFIEYMDVGGATRWSSDQVVSREEILRGIEAELGPAHPLVGRGSAPAERFQLSSGTTFGIIASTTQPFCRACDRSRLTADGMWYLCLYARVGKDLRKLLRRGASREEIAVEISQVWGAREDRGAELRRESYERTAFVSSHELQSDPHLEMHTRGG